MATFKAVHGLSFGLLLLVLPLAVLADPKEKKASPFEFVQHLRGCHKGEKVKDIHKLKKYLQNLGYLSYSKNQSAHANYDDDFDDSLESAIKTYQLNYNLKATGTLDSQTVSKMMAPRCSVADIINGTTGMRSGKKPRQSEKYSTNHNFHSVSHYAFFPRNPKWPASHSHLTYAFLPGTPADAINPVARAFRTWAANTHFTFSRTAHHANADITISFESRDHADGNPFDGPDGTLAHAFAPPDGRFHFDADERWSVSVTPGAFHLETIALHEIGHLLGLHHSSVEGAIMFPTFSAGQSKGLHGDDIQGIKALYNK